MYALINVVPIQLNCNEEISNVLYIRKSLLKTVCMLINYAIIIIFCYVTLSHLRSKGNAIA